MYIFPDAEIELSIVDAATLDVLVTLSQKFPAPTRIVLAVASANGKGKGAKTQRMR